MKTLQEIAPRLLKAERAAKAGDYDSAIWIYRQLISEHPEIAFLSEKLSALEDQYLVARVKPLVDEAQRLFKAGYLDESLELLYQATSLAPDDQSIQQAIDAVKKEIRARVIRGKLEEAYLYYEGFQWLESRKLYLEVLELDPGNEEAESGSMETSQRLTVEIKYKNAMSRAERHYRGKHYSKAMKAFNEAAAIMPEYKRLTSAQEIMRANLLKQSQIVKLIIRSDKRTWVSILGVLPPASFKEKTLEVYPNMYTIKGQRDGYRDVILEKAISADRESISLTVICTEKL